MSLLSKGPAMTRACCRDCRLRFTGDAAAYLVACPECGQPPLIEPGLEDTVGFRLFTLDDAPHPLPEAVPVSLPIDPSEGRL